MSVKKNRIGVTVGALLAFSALIAGLFISQHLPFKKQMDSAFHGTLLEKPRKIAPFNLTGTDNQSFTRLSLQKQWTLIFFGFTRCGSVCPTTMATLNRMYQLLEEKKVRPLPQIVMISIDPQRDSLEELNQYVRAFNIKFYGARGDENEIEKLTREMGVAYAKVEESNPANTKPNDIQHSAALMLFNPQGELTAFFTTPHNATWLAKDYQLLVSSV